ncbi:conserved hypothetical protein [Culex quinquefasciatus]|uniref:Uncharacterized protein n=1 Tax=Culex quinquefasciatus TaxID=7176 RepID=B0WDJ5_CULQU|nr:conserved hypothetical protein [Culex quinquefasciatus]|eukprot:XP_001846779.1 conserved hypothetical protein [Culex quinquefasciatus]
MRGSVGCFADNGSPPPALTEWQTSALTLTLTAITGTGGQFPPGPRYSLDNMPKTSFSCRDKILGGYYADSETQCQMFHVCVKVSGIGTSSLIT